MDNNKVMKRILATASTFAMLATGVTAMAQDRTTQQDDAQLSVDDHWDPAGFNSGDNVVLGGPHNLDFNVAGITISKIDINGNDGRIAEINQDATLGGISNSAVDPAHLRIVFGYFNKTLTLNGADDVDGDSQYQALSGVNNGGYDFTLVLDAGNGNSLTLSGVEFISSPGSGAIIDVQNDVELHDIIFHGLSQITVAEGKILTLSGATDLENIGDDLDLDQQNSSLVVNDTANARNVTLGAYNTEFTLNGTDADNKAKAGDVIVTAGGAYSNVLLEDYAQTGDVTLAGDGANLTLKNNSEAGIVNLNHANTTIDLYSGTLTAVDANADGVDNGTVNVHGNANIGRIGSTNRVGTLEVGDQTAVELTLGQVGKSNLKNINLNSDGSSINLEYDLIGGADSTLTFIGENTTVTIADYASIDMNIEANADNRGSLVYEGGSEIKSDIGAGDKRLKYVSMAAADKTVELHGVKIYANQNAGNDQGITLGAGTLDIQGNSTLDGYVDSDGTTIDLHNKTLTLTSGAEIKNTTLNLDIIDDQGDHGEIVFTDTNAESVTLHLEGMTINIDRKNDFDFDIGTEFQILTFNAIPDLQGDLATDVTLDGEYFTLGENGDGLGLYVTYNPPEDPNRTTRENNARLSDGGDWSQGIAPYNPDYLVLGDAHNLIFDEDIVIKSLNLAGHNGRTATIEQNATLSEVSGGNDFTIKFADDKTITLNGADNPNSKYLALSEVDFNNNDAELVLDAGDGNTLTLSGVNFLSTGVDNTATGTIDVKNNAVLENVTFKADANHKMDQITVAGGKTLTLSGNTDLANVFQDLNLANNGSSLVVNDTANARDVTLGADNTELTLNGTDNADKAKAGDVTVTAGGTNSTVLLEDHALTGDVTLTGEGANLTLKNNSEANDVALNGKNTALTINGTDNANKAKAGDVTAGGQNSTVLLEDHALTGDVTLAGSGANLTLKNNSEAGTVNLNDANTTIDLEGGTLTAVDADADDNGTVNVNQTANIGQIGETKRVGTLNVAAPEFTIGEGGASKVKNINLNANGSVDIKDNLTGGRDGGGDIDSTLSFKAAGVTVNVAHDASILDMNIAANADNIGSLVYEGDSDIKSDIGADNKRLKYVSMAAADKTVDLHGVNIYANTTSGENQGIKLGAGTLDIQGDSTLDGYVDSDGTTIDLRNHTLTLTSGAEIKNTTLHLEINQEDHGEIDFQDAGNVTLHLDNMKINIDSDGVFDINTEFQILTFNVPPIVDGTTDQVTLDGEHFTLRDDFEGLYVTYNPPEDDFRTTRRDDAKLSDGGDWSQGIAPYQTDELVLGGEHNLIFNVDGINITSLDLAGFDGKSATIEQNASLGEVYDNTESGAQLRIDFGADDKTLTLNGADNPNSKYLALSEVDFDNNDATLALNAGDGAEGQTLTLSGVKFLSDGGNNGTINVANNAVLENVKFDADDAMKQITVAGDKTLTLSGDTDLANVFQDLNLNNNGSSLVAKDAANARDVTLSGENTSLALYDDANAGNVTLSGENTSLALYDDAEAGNVFLGDETASVDLHGGALSIASPEDEGTVNVHANATINRLGAIVGQQAQQYAQRVGTLNFAANGQDPVELTLGDDFEHAVNDITTNRDRKDTINLKHNLTVGNSIGDEDHGVIISFADDNKFLTFEGEHFNADVNVPDGENRGTVIFASQAKVNGKLGSNQGRLNTVSIEGEDADVELGNSLENVELLNFDGADAKASLSSVGTNNEMNLDAITNSSGQLTLNNNGNISFGKIGDNNNLGKITLGAKGGIIVKQGAFGANELVFGQNSSESTIAKAENFNNTAITTEKSGKGVIKFTGNWTLGQDVASKNNKLNHVTYDGAGDGILDVNGKSLYADIFASNADKLKVTGLGTGANSTHYALGKKDSRLRSLDFSNVGAGNTANVEGAVFAKTINLSEPGTVKFNKDVSGGNNHNIDSALNFNSNARAVIASGASLLNLQVKTDGNNRGDLVYEGSVDIKTNIGQEDHRLNFVSMASEGRNYRLYESQIYANRESGAEQGIKLGKNTLELAEGNSMLDSYVSSEGTTFKLNKNKLTLKNGGQLSNSKFTVKVNKSADDKISNGSIEIKQADKLKLSGEFAADISTDILESGDKITLAVFDNLTEKNKQVLTDNQDRIRSLNLLNNMNIYKEDLAKNKLTLESSTPDIDHYAEVLKGQRVNAKIVSVMSQFLQNRASLSLAARNFLNIAAHEDTAKSAAKEVSRAIAGADTSSEAASLLEYISDTSSLRLSSVSTIGIASGDEDTSMNVGIWATPFYSRSVQEFRNGNVGYKSKTGSMTLGIDTMISDSTTLGLAGTYSKTEIDFKDDKSGDKQRVNNIFFNAYARHNLQNNWYVQGVVGFGKGKVKEANLRDTHLEHHKTLTADYDRVSFNIDGRAGYNYVLSDYLSVIPEAGLRYSVVNDAGFTEKGNAALAKKVSKEASDRLTALFATKIEGRYNVYDTKLKPEVHAQVGYDVKSSNPKVISEIGGMRVDTTPGNAARFKYSVGLGVNAETNKFEYGIAYDAKFADKYVSHQGILKVRVNL